MSSLEEYQKEHLKNEIKEIEDTIIITGHFNKKNGIKRKALKTTTFAKYSLPFLVTTGITFSLFSTCIDTPFVKDSYDATLGTKKEIDNFGIVRTEQEYKRKHNIEGTISYTSAWQENEDGTWTRESRSYLTQDIEENIITRIVQDMDIESLDDVFGTPTSNKKETKNALTDKELSLVPYMQAIIYSEDKDDFITITESDKSNIIWTTIWLVVNLFANALVYDEIDKATAGKFKKSFQKCMESINEKYPHIDTKELQKKLELKLNQYAEHSK